jgi:hypothetical protein
MCAGASQSPIKKLRKSPSDPSRNAGIQIGRIENGVEREKRVGSLLCTTMLSSEILGSKRLATTPDPFFLFENRSVPFFPLHGLQAHGLRLVRPCPARRRSPAAAAPRLGTTSDPPRSQRIPTASPASAPDAATAPAVACPTACARGAPLGPISREEGWSSVWCAGLRLRWDGCRRPFLGEIVATVPASR